MSQSSQVNEKNLEESSGEKLVGICALEAPPKGTGKASILGLGGLHISGSICADQTGKEVVLVL